MLEKFMFFLLGLCIFLAFLCVLLIIFSPQTKLFALQPSHLVEMLDLWAEYEVWWCSKDKGIFLTANCSPRRAGQRHLREAHPTFNGFVLWLKNVRTP